MKELEGKVALITGAARGQGRSHAVRLARAGAAIIALDICAPIEGISYNMATRADLAETKTLVEATGSRMVSAVVDTRNSGGLAKAVDECTALLGGLDIVVANAGVAAMNRWNDFDDEQWKAIIGVNIFGTWNTMRATIPHLITRGGGSLIAIASVAGLAGMPFLEPYVASKHAIVGLVKTLAIELAENKIRVNAICPTGVAGTGIQIANSQALLTQASEKIRSTYSNAFDVASIPKSAVSDAVLFFSSDASRWITGDAMPVDAGLLDL